MIERLQHVGSNHRCNVCSAEYEDGDGGTEGYFGILPVAFCGDCMTNIVDMVKVLYGVGIEDE